MSLSAVNSTTYSIQNQSLTSGELYSVTNDDQYSYFKLDASTNCSITSIEIRYSCVYVDTTVFEFVKVDGGYELSNYNGDGGDVTIPDTYLGLPVISIGNSAFKDCSSLISTTIPDSVTTIGESAFYYCSNLTTVTIGENSQLTTIGNSAFYWCSSLTLITIPNNVTSIGVAAFYNCDSLTSITIPDSVTTIGDSAFLGCYNLTIYCEAASKPSGWSSYWNNSYCPVVWVGGDIIVDGDYAYVVRTSGEERYVEIVRYIGSVEEVIIPDTINVDGENISVTSIGERAFYYCSSLTSIVIPDSVTSIGVAAFYNCDSLTSITIPDSVTTIDPYAFYDCSSLTIYCEAASQPSGWISNWNPSNRPVVWDCLNAKTTNDGFVYHVYENGYGTKYIVIDAYIGTATEVVIPDTININDEEIKVTTIGERAFYDDDTITSVTIGNNVTSIGDYAFYSCGSLTSIIIPDSVTTIGESAFFNCYSLISITIPNNVTTIGNYAFCGCNNLTTVTFGENSQLTSIADYAFAGCFSLTSIIIPSSVTTIGSSAFENCDSLTSIIIPDSVTTIGSSAFCNCSSLTSIIIPNSVTTIGSNAFSWCFNLTIYCEAASQPSGWSSSWNYSNRPVVWGYTGE